MRKSILFLLILITASFGQITIHDLDITEFCMTREIDEMGLNSEYSNPAYIINKTDQLSTNVYFAGSNPASQLSYIRNLDKYGVVKLIYTQMFGSDIAIDYYDPPAMRYADGEIIPDSDGEYYYGNIAATNTILGLGYAKTFKKSLVFGMDWKYYSFNRSAGRSHSLAATFGFSWRTKLLSKNRVEGLNLNISLSNISGNIELFKISLPYINDGAPRWLQITPPTVLNLGLSFVPFQWNNQYIKASIDAVHPNYMAESLDMNLKYNNKTNQRLNYYFSMGYRQSIGDPSDYDRYANKYYDRNDYYGFSFGAGFEYQLKNGAKIFSGFAFTENENELFKRRSFNLGYKF